MKDTIKESGNESLLSVRELSFSYDKGLPDVFGACKRNAGQIHSFSDFSEENDYG